MRKFRCLAAVVVATAMMAILPVFAIAGEDDPSDGWVSALAPQASALASDEGAAVSMYRLYNPNSGEHFYTAKADERAALIGYGWNDEGIGWTAPESSATPVYRLYNANGGEHHYTMDVGERAFLLGAGWNDEGIGWYSDDAKGVPLYRDYNPNAFANNHNYTVAASEHRMLIDAGWRDEGYAWYGLAASSDSAGEDPAAEDPAANVHHASVKVEGYDEFVITVDEDSAPISAQNFCKLAESGYYDGLAFYRIVDGFCLQGGTKGDNAAGNDPELEPIAGEFRANGIDNPLADDFRKGTVAMARTNDYNSATSTFFITLGTSLSVSLSLNGQYAAFGTIDEAGMQVVDAICNDHIAYATGPSGAITDSAKMPRIESITITD